MNDDDDDSLFNITNINTCKCKIFSNKLLQI